VLDVGREQLHPRKAQLAGSRASHAWPAAPAHQRHHAQSSISAAPRASIRRSALARPR
jgi:hypothetical protein